jgi:diacylglycerol kinase
VPDSPPRGTTPGGDYRAALAGRLTSFRYAFAGIRYVLGEPNFRVQLSIFAVALIVAAVVRVRPGEWLAIVLVGLAVLVMEMLNTVIEAVVDLTAPEYHPLAKTAKDVAAGAVLLAAFASIIVAGYIFVPRLATAVHGLG